MIRIVYCWIFTRTISNLQLCYKLAVQYWFIWFRIANTGLQCIIVIRENISVQPEYSKSTRKWRHCCSKQFFKSFYVRFQKNSPKRNSFAIRLYGNNLNRNSIFGERIYSGSRFSYYNKMKNRNKLNHKSNIKSHIQWENMMDGSLKIMAKNCIGKNIGRNVFYSNLQSFRWCACRVFRNKINKLYEDLKAIGRQIFRIK